MLAPIHPPALPAAFHPPPADTCVPALIPPGIDPAQLDMRTFYPYQPNEVKHRKRTTRQQLRVLESVYDYDTKPNAALRKKLSAELDMTPRGVQVWFQNRRAKSKQQAKKAAAGHTLPASSPHADEDEDGEDNAEDGNGDDGASSTGTLCPRPSPHVASSPLQQFAHSPHLHPHLALRRPSLPALSSLHPPAPAPLHRNGSTDVFPNSSTLTHHHDQHTTNSSSNHTNTYTLPVSPTNAPPPLRRSSVDAAAHRLAAHPFAPLVALPRHASVSGAGSVPRHGSMPHSLSPHSLSPHSLSPHSLSPHSLSSHQNARRVSLSPYPARVPLGRVPSPSGHSLPTRFSRGAGDGVLPHIALAARGYAPRVYAPPAVPGPLPAPGYSFGQASSTGSGSTETGEKTSGSGNTSTGTTTNMGEEREYEASADGDTEDDGSEALSRFGSIASVSSFTSAGRRLSGQTDEFPEFDGFAKFELGGVYGAGVGGGAEYGRGFGGEYGGAGGGVGGGGGQGEYVGQGRDFGQPEFGQGQTQAEFCCPPGFDADVRRASVASGHFLELFSDLGVRDDRPADGADGYAANTSSANAHAHANGEGYGTAAAAAAAAASSSDGYPAGDAYPAATGDAYAAVNGETYAADRFHGAAGDSFRGAAGDSFHGAAGDSFHGAAGDSFHGASADSFRGEADVFRGESADSFRSESADGFHGESADGFHGESADGGFHGESADSFNSTPTDAFHTSADAFHVSGAYTEPLYPDERDASQHGSIHAHTARKLVFPDAYSFRPMQDTGYGDMDPIYIGGAVEMDGMCVPARAMDTGAYMHFP